jgi:hypothetical protein
MTPAVRLCCSPPATAAASAAAAAALADGPKSNSGTHFRPRWVFSSTFVNLVRIDYPVFRHVSFDDQVSLQESSATRRHSVVMSGVILSRHKFFRSNSTFAGELAFLELQFRTFEFALQGCDR